MKIYFILLLPLIAFSLLSCSGSDSKQEKKGSLETNTLPKNWSITFERIGGVAGFRDKLVLKSDMKGEYYSGEEKKTDFEIIENTMVRLRWVLNRDDFLKANGEYKGEGKVMDDITYIIEIVMDDQVWEFKWASHAPHPAILDEIRPTFDEILTDVRKLVSDESQTG